MFNFDSDIFMIYEKNVTDYLDAISNKQECSQTYDLLNIKARDKMNAVLDTVRLRDSYLREFKYTQSKSIFGDIELQLEHKCHRFSLDASNQLDTAASFSSLTQSQLNDMRALAQALQEAIEKYEASEIALVQGEQVFNEFVERVQKNVVESLISIGN
jgi:hypothetical protein